MKDKKVKLRTKIFRWILVLSFVAFLTLYFGNKLGYYEYKNYQKSSLTEEQIRKFEQDVKDGKEVDLEDYVVNTNKNYQNSLSKTGLNISDTAAGIIKKGVEGFFNSISKMVVESED